MLNTLLGKSTNIESALKKGPKLRSLELIYPTYDLSAYRDEFENFTNLSELTIQVSIDYAFDLPKELGELNNLRKLQIINYPFNEISSWVFKLQNLRNLLLRGNDITKIPDEIRQLKKLKHLRIENTALSSVSESLSSLDNLKTLSLVDNFRLEKINPNSLPKNLKWLALKPSGIPREQVDKLMMAMPGLKNKRYFK